MKNKTLSSFIKEVVAKKNHILLTETDNSLVENLYLFEISTLDQLTSGIKWLKENDINGVILGGTAVAHYVKKGRELTPDIDILVSSLNDVKRKLEKDNISYKELKGYNNDNLGIFSEKFNIDFLDIKNNYELYSLVLKTANNIQIAGESFKIINPELLTIMKLNLGREKDLNDAILLLQSGSLNKEKFTVYTNQLKNNLEDYESIIGYSEML